MSAENCDITLGVGNTGSTAQPISTLLNTLWFQLMESLDGTLNAIPYAGSLDQSTLDALINNPDVTKRIYPLGPFKNVVNERGESTFEEFDDATKVKIRKGIRNILGWIIEQSPEYLKKINKFGCDPFGFYIIDDCENFIFDGSVAGEARPIRADEKSVDNNLLFASGSTVQKIQVSFDWHKSSKDENLKLLTKADWSGADLLGAKGLVDVFGINVTGLTITTFTIDLVACFGSAKSPFKFKGFLIGDFEIFNETDDAVVAIITLTEAPDGTYTFTFVTQTGDNLELRYSKDGFDDTELRKAIILIP